jgi:hypothetical protein
LIIHLYGGFHSENRLTAVEHLALYNFKALSLVVTIKSATGFPNFDSANDAKAGDLVILRDPKLLKSFNRN